MNYSKCLYSAVFTAISAGAILQAQPRLRYEVSVTNLTRGQRLTPVLVASHEEGVKIFELGMPASPELRMLAEEGAVTPLAVKLSMDPRVLNITNSTPPPPVSNLVDPGETITVQVEAGGKFDHFTVASMLIPTNDGFIALNGMPGPKGSETVSYLIPAYDAGTEKNDELCSSIPGPGFTECGGDGGGAPVSMGEGFVHIHGGIHGVGNFNAALRDWRNPVARISIRRLP